MSAVKAHTSSVSSDDRENIPPSPVRGKPNVPADKSHEFGDTDDVKSWVRDPLENYLILRLQTLMEHKMLESIPIKQIGHVVSEYLEMNINPAINWKKTWKKLATKWARIGCFELRDGVLYPNKEILEKLCTSTGLSKAPAEGEPASNEFLTTIDKNLPMSPKLNIPEEIPEKDEDAANEGGSVYEEEIKDFKCEIEPIPSEENHYVDDKELEEPGDYSPKNLIGTPKACVATPHGKSESIGRINEGRISSAYEDEIKKLAVALTELEMPDASLEPAAFNLDEVQENKALEEEEVKDNVEPRNSTQNEVNEEITQLTESELPDVAAVESSTITEPQEKGKHSDEEVAQSQDFSSLNKESKKVVTETVVQSEQAESLPIITEEPQEKEESSDERTGNQKVVGSVEELAQSQNFSSLDEESKEVVAETPAESEQTESSITTVESSPTTDVQENDSKVEDRRIANTAEEPTRINVSLAGGDKADSKPLTEAEISVAPRSTLEQPNASKILEQEIAKDNVEFNHDEINEKIPEMPAESQSSAIIRESTIVSEEKEASETDRETAIMKPAQIPTSIDNEMKKVTVRLSPESEQPGSSTAIVELSTVERDVEDETNEERIENERKTVKPAHHVRKCCFFL